MGVSKVVYDGDTLMDLTSDTVTPSSLAKGVTATNAAGERIVGTMPTTSVLYTEQSLTDAQKAQARNNIGALPTSGGELSGDLTLKAASGNSPALNFQRGTLTDNYNDWRLQDRSGFLYFDQRGSGSTDWQTIFHLTQSGATLAGSMTATSFNGNASSATKLTTSAGSVNQPVYFKEGKPVACGIVAGFVAAVVE